MGDNKSTSSFSSSAKNYKKKVSISEEEKVASHGDFTSSQKENTEESISSESTSRLSRKTIRKQTKDKLDNDAPKTTSGESPNEGSSEPSEIQNQNKSQSGKTDRIKTFALKGAGAKVAASVGEITENALKDTKRRMKSIAIESVIRPAEQQIDEHQPFKPTRGSVSDLPLQKPEQEIEIMRKEILQNEQEDQTLATLIISLLKRRKSEMALDGKLALSEAEALERSKHMSPLEQAGIICILEETIDKLSVLGFTHGKPVVKPEIKYISLLDKLGKKEKSELIDLIESNESAEEFENQKHFIKLQKDRGFLEEALTLTLSEMKQMGTFKILQDIVHLEEGMVKEEADLRFDGRNRQQEVNHCKALLERECTRGIKKLEDRTVLLATLKTVNVQEFKEYSQYQKALVCQPLSDTLQCSAAEALMMGTAISETADEIQNLVYYKGLKYKYLDHWETSRTEQNAMMLQNREKDLIKKLSDYEELTSIELRCNAEIKAFIEQNMQELSKAVEEWMVKYESELEEREVKLTKLKEEREEHMKKLQEKTKQFNERQRQINEWKAYKEKQRLEAEYQALLIRMAIRIQAWWRGTMVRKHLGPYKKKGKKKKKKN